MADPMKIRAQMKGDFAEVRILMGHAMETGQRKDAAGKAIPAHFIQSMTVEVGGKKVVDGQIGTSISRNPVFGFKVKGAKAGDKVVVNWVDNKGDKRTDEAAVA
ncbi:MAG: thiosulfate oxidation carrier complex protein SoxZ [Sulfuritalea sp.]|jgi:sulfur-oxidizing protein SoxZ|nr:thiosulfate oxidation carrier complex protein SoxZ [Sulfuritalea sp.]MDP1981197.1 thiosulfate oxidation carrier complex protein SoxZ [Sulfuritalea sp.]